MCESRVFIDKKDGRALVMDEVIHLVVEGEAIKLTGILGETRAVKGRIKEIDLMKHTIVIGE